ncbi:MAG: hypothetical protein ABI954_08080 [Pyrinomonadaceae bacterium]
MENKTRRTEIFIETHSVTIIRTNSKPLSVWCEVCRKVVTAFSPEQIALALRLDGDAMREFCQTGEIHSINDNNSLLCGDSLAAHFRN